MGETAETWDVLLMAVADGEASLADQQKVAAALAQDPSLASRFEGFQRTGRSLGGLFDGLLNAPVPGHLVETVRISGLAAGQQRLAFTAPDVPSAWSQLFGWLGDWLADWQMPVAGLAALALGFAGGAALMSQGIFSGTVQTAMSDAVTPGAAVAEALTVIPTGAEHAVVTAHGTLNFRVVETFVNTSGAACREYEAQAATGPRQYGIACRDGTAWHLNALFEGAPKAAAATSTAGPGALGEMLDGLVEHMRQGDALSSDAERKLKDTGWVARAN